MKNKIIVILLLIVCITVMCFSVFGTVSAAELSNDSIYNFNQLIQNGNFLTVSNWSAVGGSYTVSDNIATFVYSSDPTSYFSNCMRQSNISFVNNHIYYYSFSFKADQSCVVRFDIRNFADSFYYTDVNNFTTFDRLATYSNQTTTSVYIGVNSGVFSNGDSFQISNVYVIDLTLMFGSGNEPTIEQCQQIFTSHYYNYTTGTPLSLSGINAYQQGVSDTIQSFDVITLPSVTTSSIFPINIGDVQSSVSAGTGDGLSIALIRGYGGIPFRTLIPSNTQFTFHFDKIAVADYQSFTNIYFGYISSSGSFIPIMQLDYNSIGTIDSGNWSLSDSSFDFVIPVDIEYFVIYCDVLPDQSVGILSGLGLQGCYFSYRVFNNDLFVSNAYDSGYNAGLTTGKNQGYQNGYTAGLNAATENDYSFLGLLSSVVQAPITVLVGDYDASTGQRVGGLLNFELLGYNMSTFLMSLFSLAVVICVVRLFI